MNTENIVAPLGISDTALAVDLMISSAPIGLMIRELLMNGIEAKQFCGEKFRLIRFFADDDGKLSIVNSGKGMSEDELVEYTNLSSSTKTTRGDGYINRGEGAKISSCNNTRLGMVCTSKSIPKNSVEAEINRVELRLGENGWGRVRYKFDDNGEPWYGEVDYVQDTDLTEQEKKRFSGFTGEFTEVYLRGNRKQHQTAFDPYDVGYKSDMLYVPHEAFSRFYRFPDIGIPLTVEFSKEFRGGQEFRKFMTIEEVVKKYPDKFTNLDQRFVEINTKEYGKVIIEYLHNTLDSSRRHPFSNYSFGAGCHGAIVWRNEMYDVSVAEAWRRETGTYGLFGLGSELSIFVHLPDEVAMPDRYRERIMSLKNENINLSDFKELIYKSRPQWVVDMVKNKIDKNSKAITTEEVKKDLIKYFGSLIKVPTGKISKNGKIEINTVRSGNDFDSGGTQKGDGSKERGENTGEERQPSGSEGDGSPNSRKRRKDDSTDSTKSSIFDISWLDSTNIKDRPQLAGKGADYVDTGEAMLFMNREYPAFDEILECIYDKYVPKQYREMTEPLAIKFIGNHISYNVGKAVLLAKRKKGLKHWTSSDIGAAITPEALSIVFDQCRDDVGLISNRMMQTNNYKNAVSEVDSMSIISITSSEILPEMA